LNMWGESSRNAWKSPKVVGKFKKDGAHGGAAGREKGAD